MDINKILKSDYIDILFEGKNKKYGGYELRKKYKKRAFLSLGVIVGIVAISFAASKIKPKEEVAVAPPPPPIEDVVLQEPPPIEDNAPPPPPVSTPPPPVKSTFKFEPPVVKKNEEVRETEKIEKIPDPEENKVAGPSNTEGSDDPRALDPGLSTQPSGTGTVISGGGESEDPNKVYTQVQQKAKPSYDLNAFVQKNLVYPEVDRAAENEGTVMVSFIVEKDGSLTSIKVDGKAPSASLGREAVEVLKKAPKWEPAKQNGNAVRSYFRYPIRFRLDR